MTNPYLSEEIIERNQKSLEDLIWIIEASAGEFSLIFAHCNDTGLRECVMKQLQELCSIPIQVIVLKASDKTLYTAIQAQLWDKQPPAVLVLGLEVVRDIDSVLISANRVREEFRKTFFFPLVLWIDDKILQKLIRLAPDLESWGTTTKFESADGEENDFCCHRADYLRLMRCTDRL